jgi:predicted AlkP superfamily phosphohydrolase/phosphomutase
MMVFFPGIDRVSHWLWGNLEPPEKYPPRLQPNPGEREAGAAALHGYYRYTDALIGLLLARYGENDLVMVVSDHGFEAGVHLMTLTGRHASDEALDGVIFARGPGIPRGSPAGPIGVNDVTPTILSWLGIPPSRDMDGRPAAFLAGPRPEPVASYRDLKIERLAARGAGLEDTIVEQLRELGYLEVPAGERPPGKGDEEVQSDGVEVGPH